MLKLTLVVCLIFLCLSACSSTQEDLGSEGTAYINRYGLAYTTTAYRFSLEDGTEVWGIDCSGAELNFGHCHNRAKHLCPDGYVVKNQTSSDGGASAVIDPQFGGSAKRSIDRSITIACNT